jgi:deazaflavin-dependent oxidoreductase (nitroreductase family)
MATSPPVVRAGAAGAAKLLRVRWLVRAPIWAYRVRLGALFGSHLVMLEHTGTMSGRRRFAVPEVVGHPAPGTYLVVSDFGGRAQWFPNIQANPRVRRYAGSRRPAPATARILTRDQARTALAAYAAARPRAWATLMPAPEKPSAPRPTTCPWSQWTSLPRPRPKPCRGQAA